MITKEQIESLDGRLSYLKECLGIDGKRTQVEDLQKKTESPDFWNDPKAAESFLKDLNATKSWVTDYDKAATAIDDVKVLYDFAKESLEAASDEALETEETRELDASYADAVKTVEDLELKNMLGGEGDNLGAILTINSGAGGTESNDWSSMLM
ncbi:MAG: PCRF domain-containing protein, partial [Bacteroidales bacterium]|nr:PCRF domain-containing protein [Bacteroidales bacterium]